MTSNTLGKAYAVTGVETRRDLLGSYTVLIFRTLFAQAHHWQLPDGRNGVTIIPAGYPTDFATLTRLIRTLKSPWDGPTGKFTLHDYHYQLESFGEPETETRTIWGAITSKARKDADDAFLFGMRKEGFRLALLYYLAVRACGWIVWKKHTTEQVLAARRKYDNGTTGRT